MLHYPPKGIPKPHCSTLEQWGKSQKFNGYLSGIGDKNTSAAETYDVDFAVTIDISDAAWVLGYRPAAVAVG